jgi:hypothetical protein
MKTEFIPYEQALALKELGFDEPCLAFYNGKFLDSTQYNFDTRLTKDIGQCISAPTFSQAFRWFREKYDIDGLLHKTVEGSYYFWITECEYENYNHYKYYNQMVYFNTYEEAELACLIKLIKIVKKK